MTYFGFLFIFLIIPIIILGTLSLHDRRRGRTLPAALASWPPQVAIVGHVLIALVYTTPWDNYLVATRVWWYDPDLVTGIVFGWVPIEEYTFFLLQPILTGLWLVYLGRRLTADSDNQPTQAQLRWQLTGLVAMVWIGAVTVLLSRWQPGTYLALELAWALPPIMLQLGFGADILWQHRRLVFLSLVPTTLYLSAADALAIASGTWTINPVLSLEIYLGGVLPLEEFIFFLLTNTLVSFGIVLVLARQSRDRLRVRLAGRLLQPGSDQSTGSYID